MINNNSRNRVTALVALSFLSVSIISATNFVISKAQAAPGDATVVVLTQTGCQFLESEKGVDHKFKPKSAKDCKVINAKTGKDRVAKAGPLKLKPGKYMFRVTNKNVPYALGFWLRSKG